MTDPTGVVYDLGYKPHEGNRLGRSGAVPALYRDGLRRVLGLRRKGRKKIMPWLLLGIALIPAAVGIGLEFLLDEFTEIGSGIGFFGHEGYFDMTAILALLFIALAGPELLIPDRTQGVLALYSSRPLRVSDYLGGRAASLATVVLGFLLIPQLALYVGRAALADQGFVSYFLDESGVLLDILLAALGFFGAYAGIAFLISAFASRTAVAAGVYLAVMTASNGIAGAVSTQAVDLPGRKYAALFALEQHPRYVRDWIFGSAASSNTVPAEAGLDPWMSLAMVLLIVAATGIVTVRRYRRIM
jgi:ABC-2 type transport system permease protein